MERELKKIRNNITGEVRYGVILKEEFPKTYYALTDKRRTEVLVVSDSMKQHFDIRFAHYVGEPFPPKPKVFKPKYVVDYDKETHMVTIRKCK